MKASQELHQLGEEKVQAVLDKALPWVEQQYSEGRHFWAVACVMAGSGGARQFGWRHKPLQSALDKVSSLLS